MKLLGNGNPKWASGETRTVLIQGLILSESPHKTLQRTYIFHFQKINLLDLESL